MGSNQSTPLAHSPRSMDTQQPNRQIPRVRFRVLIIGRANAGKTSILQRVCETTESPIVYRGNSWPKVEVRVLTFLSASLVTDFTTRSSLTRPSMLVTI